MGDDVSVGDIVGTHVGCIDGVALGDVVGTYVGCIDGGIDGTGLGEGFGKYKISVIENFVLFARLE